MLCSVVVLLRHGLPNHTPESLATSGRTRGENGLSKTALNEWRDQDSSNTTFLGLPRIFTPKRTSISSDVLAQRSRVKPRDRQTDRQADRLTHRNIGSNNLQ